MAELRLVLERHTQQPADDRHRQRVGEVFDDVEPPLSAIRSSNPSTSALISGCSAFTTFGANALLTSLRSRV